MADRSYHNLFDMHKNQCVVIRSVYVCMWMCVRACGRDVFLISALKICLSQNTHTHTTLHYTHYTTLHYTTLHYTTLHTLHTLHAQVLNLALSGESGAGKTESAKLFLGHLLRLSQSEHTAMARRYDLLHFAMNTMLEAFGNAQVRPCVRVCVCMAWRLRWKDGGRECCANGLTPRFCALPGHAQTRANHNSSRFGKYVQLEFDAHCIITGARLEHYVLEKSRVVHQVWA